MDKYITNKYKMARSKSLKKPYISSPNGLKARRGKIKGTHKIQTPRLLIIFLKTIMPSRTLQGKEGGKALIHRLDNDWLDTIKKIKNLKEQNVKEYKYQQIKLVDDEKVVQEAIEGYIVSLGGFLNITALDLLLMIIDEAVQQQKQVLRFTIYDILKKLELKNSGQNYTLIRTQIKKLSKIGFVFNKEQQIVTKEWLELMSGLQLFTFFSIKITEYVKHEDLDVNVSTIEFRLTDEFFASIQKYGLIDSQIYKGIKEPSLKLLYVYLCLMDHNQKYMKRKGKDLLNELNIKVDDHYKRKIKNMLLKIKGKTLLSIDAEYDTKKDIIMFKY